MAKTTGFSNPVIVEAFRLFWCDSTPNPLVGSHDVKSIKPLN
jgi:hypothetical protein